MLIAAGVQLNNPAVVQSAETSVDLSENLLGLSSAFETAVCHMSSVQFGQVRYPLRGLLKCYFIRAKEEFVAEGLSPEFVGKGSTLERAQDDFCENLHAGIQSLIYRRPFELSSVESELWRKLETVVDITVFKNRTPIVLQQYGVVMHGHLDRPCKIRWDNGYTEDIDLRRVGSPDFINFETGQPIFAVVRRNPISREIIDIPVVKRTNPLPAVQEMKESGFKDAVLNSPSFPESDWD